MPLLNDLRAFLVAQSGIVTTEWPCFIAYMPDDSDTVIALFETGGYPQDTHQGENEDVTFQVRVRGSQFNYESTRVKWKECFDALHDSSLGAGYSFCQAAHMGPMAFNDEKGRPNFTSNFKVKKSV